MATHRSKELSGNISTIEDLEANRTWKNVPTPPPPRTPPVDASILGLFSFAISCVVLSFYNAHVGNITIPNVAVGVSIALGGLGQLVAGIFELVRGSTFTGTLFMVYTGFWLSYAIILLPDSGILAAYADSSEMLGNALGIYLITFALVTLLFLLVAVRKTIALNITLVSLFVTFTLLSAANFTGSVGLSKAGGAFGLFTAAAALYIATGGLLALEPHSLFTLPMGVLA